MFSTLLRDFFDNLSGKQRLFALVLILALLAILLALWTKGIAATILVTCAIVAILWITRRIWLPEEYGKALVRKYSLWVVLITATTFSGWNSTIESYIIRPAFKFLQNRFTQLQEYQLLDATPSIVVLIFVLLGVFVVNYFMRDKTTMKAHPTPIEKEFPEKGYKQRLEGFCRVLRQDLREIDRATNWSTEYFTPLEAEVEVQSKNRRRKKITDLLTAIKSDRKSRVALVLGDPGSGKSVALRTLCQDLLEEVDKTGKVPIYINLREWEIDKEWSEKNPPTPQQLYNFVLSNLKDRGDVFANEFLDEYFKKMFDNGRLYLVLDSFDEIPAVLDVDESSWLIDRLSHVIYLFLAGAHESTGILASRVFRKPTRSFESTITLEIRPFTEWRIIECLTKSMSYNEKLARDLIANRPELVPLARNPFSAALISRYAKDHDNALPGDQAQLYSGYILNRLKSCGDRIRQRNLTIEKIIQCATDIADLMFSKSDYGLEAPLRELEGNLLTYPISDVIYILDYARLARIGRSEEQLFSFAHRRFNEYFVAQKFIQEPERIPKESIPTDSRWRDALVLYCEVSTDEEKITEIANFCWSEVRKITELGLQMDDPRYLRGIHSLRFLSDAFRSNLGYISPFRYDLANFIDHQVGQADNLLATKLSVEATGLLHEEEIDATLIKAFSHRNAWISETALKSCRHLPQISRNLEEKVKTYLLSLRPSEFLARYKELLFSFSLSNGFGRLHSFCKRRFLDICSFFLGLFLLFILNPLLVLLPTLAIYLYFSFSEESEELFGGEKTSVYQAGYGILMFNAMLYAVIPKQTPSETIGHAIRRITDGIIYFNYFDLELFSWSTVPSIIFSLLWLASFILILPWQRLAMFVSEIRREIGPAKIETPRISPRERIGRSITFMRDNISILAGIIGILAFMGSFVYLIYMLDQKYPIIFWILGCLVFSFIAIFLCVLVYIKCIQRFKDSKLLKTIPKAQKVKRDEIARCFRQFETPKGRLSYVTYLDTERIEVKGTWPEGKLPNERDEASTILAQLEARWLGLD